MKKLNNKGMTSIEVLLSFIVVVMLSVSMYTTISAYQNKQNIESFKEKIMTYKNLLTKEINDDLIKKGLIAVNVESQSYNAAGNTVEDEAEGRVRTNYTITFTLKNGQQKRMLIHYAKASDSSSGVSASNDVNDSFIISYGDINKEMEYPIPNLGSTKNSNGKIVYDLRINSVEIDTEDGIFSVMIGFTHPDLTNRYYVSIVCPINF